MKAIILAGGEGSRLRPLSVNRPKPMVRLFDRPVLEHIVLYLKSHGIDQLCVTLQTMPYAIADYFEKGEMFGVHMEYRIEKEPLGTAGAGCACADFLSADEDFLVISGDAVLDLDIGPALEEHARRRAAATLVLHKNMANLLDYGLVMTDADHHITRFIEKPSWGQVFCDTVNTGLYILNAALLRKIPSGVFFDFARDLFPQMLRENVPLLGIAAAGYWCDMGDTEAYRKCAFDALSGKVKLSWNAPQVAEGVWSASKLPHDVTIQPPVYIGADVYLGHRSVIGPFAVIGARSMIGDRTVIQHSVVDGLQTGQDCRINGAVACVGDVLRDGVTLKEGAVLGDHVVVGAHAVVCEDARVWPNKEIEAGDRVSGTLNVGYRRRGATFDGQGRVSGQINVDITPEYCLRLGVACGELSGGTMGLSYTGGSGARMAALCLEAGLTASGGQMIGFDATTAAACAWMAQENAWPLTAHITQTAGRLDLIFFEADGLPLGHLTARKMEGLVMRGEARLTSARTIHEARVITGVDEDYVSAAVGALENQEVTGAEPMAVSVTGHNESTELLCRALTQAGFRVSREGGLPAFAVGREGFSLSVTDEAGVTRPFEQVLALMAALEWKDGQRTLALPYGAPAVLEALADKYGGQLLRVGRDGAEARAGFSNQPIFRDGLRAALYLARKMRAMGTTVSGLAENLTPFAVKTAEVGLLGDRGEMMRHLAERYDERDPELIDGLRARVGGGWIHVAPLAGSRALRITGEAVNSEIAAELCDDFRRLVRKLDGRRV